ELVVHSEPPRRARALSVRRRERRVAHQPPRWVARRHTRRTRIKMRHHFSDPACVDLLDDRELLQSLDFASRRRSSRFATASLTPRFSIGPVSGVAKLSSIFLVAGSQKVPRKRSRWLATTMRRRPLGARSTAQGRIVCLPDLS